MSKTKRGMSRDEKKMAMLKYLLEHPVPFTMKELERIGPKVGVTSMTVKDAVMDGVYDGYVSTDKCGTQTLFWAFPSETAKQKVVKLEQLTGNAASLEAKLVQLEEQKALLSVGREESKERRRQLAKLDELKRRNAEIKAGLDMFKENDPDILRKMEETVPIAKEAANRWTDNMFAMRSWLKNTLHLSDDDITHQFFIPDEMDYVD
ncbi:putative Meiotic nuclear division protein 1 like protein [Blattamonas nauphoetae]|uniref:Meiotic nuclear division protein 1 like protein n=1 Tax=Blattamonas nauphoetae TaxID=2049346 RepID=A0ABQ9Y9G9_9EUKA|nr:putative Meiotic nuclear division protein 1 like protein [Blattamonas nauphoetae]